MSDNNQVPYTVFDDDNNIKWTGTCPSSDLAKQGVDAGLHVTYGDQDVQIAMILSVSYGNPPPYKIEITEDGIFHELQPNAVLMDIAPLPVPDAVASRNAEAALNKDVDKG